jgi:hypothetical protein
MRQIAGCSKSPPAAFSLLEGFNVPLVRLSLLTACGLAGELFEQPAGLIKKRNNELLNSGAGERYGIKNSHNARC